MKEKNKNQSDVKRWRITNILSQFTGKLMWWVWPSDRFRKWSLEMFVSFFGINEKEAEKPLLEYSCVGEFFIRRLKAGARTISNDFPWIHPCDSKITQWGEIHRSLLIQAKGMSYNLEALLGGDKYEDGGVYFTYYLSPKDYHRVHFPVSGEIEGVTHIPGCLWPVNEIFTHNLKNLFIRNERVVVQVKTDDGLISIVLVGALNVGNIQLTFNKSSQLKFKSSNSSRFEQNLEKELPFHLQIKNTFQEERIVVEKGQELGYFSLGSTVVVVYPQSFKKHLYQNLSREEFEKKISRNVHVLMGSSIQ